ncbi:acyltransferase family protein [Quadrisphaera granulorum]|uniref:acyltransferase family protein n=1 Tax=Quadrisphaera granulorum TaxID=317664 RepID=UPI001474D39F|nr:acyltransferase [Quadrisphaera granulorum]
MSSRRIDSLDGLRALAVTLVVIHHALHPHIFGGFIGVDIFFVLSGYLITSIIRRQILTGNFKLLTFYWNRSLRLYPALILVVMICLPVGLFFERDRAASSQLWDAAIALAYVTNIVQYLTGVYRGLWSHAWSLSMEEQFYLLWPALLILLVRLRASRCLSLWLLAALFGISIGFYSLDFSAGLLAFSPLSRMQGLVAGSLLAIALESKPVQGFALDRRKFLLGAGFVLLLIALVIGSFRHAWWPVPVATLGAFVLLMGLLADTYEFGFVSRIFTWRPAMYIGSISYGIYLWHFPLQHFAYLLPGRSLVWLPIMTILSIGLAAASHRWIEIPMLRLRIKRS